MHHIWQKKKISNEYFYRILQLLMALPILQYVRIVFYIWDSFVLNFIKKPKSSIKREKKQVLIVFPFALGDCILFLGSLINMRKVYPTNQYTIHLICQKGYEGLFQGYFDNIFSLDFAQMSLHPMYRIKMCRIVRRMYYDIALDPIGCEVCSPNVFIMNAVCADEKIGVFTKYFQKVQCPSWMRKHIYTKIISLPNADFHKLKQYAYIWQMLGSIQPLIKPAVLPRMELNFKLPEKYFVIFPSASLKVKQWPIERFAVLAERIYKKTGFTLVVCGTHHDANTVNLFLKQIPKIPKVNYVGKTSVEEFMEVIARAELLVTNDTSAYHIGVAHNIKVCVITGCYVYNSFINYDCLEKDRRKPVVICRKLRCHDCNNNCIYFVRKVYPCVMANTVEDAWNALLQLLEST